MTDSGSGRVAQTPRASVLTSESLEEVAIAVGPSAVDERLPIAPLLALATLPLLAGIISVAYLPILPAIARSYRASAEFLGLTVSVPALVGAAAYPIGGRLGDLYGRRRVLLALVALFIVGSASLVAFHSDAALLLGRSAQAAIVAAAPLGVALVTELVGVERRARVLPPIVAVTGVGFGLGFLGSALVVEHLGLRALSAGLAVLGALSILAVWAIVHPPRAPRGHGRVDWLGAVLLCGPIAMLLLALGQGSSWGWSSPQIIALLSAVPIVLPLFAIRQSRITDGLVPRDLLARRAIPVTYLLGAVAGLAITTLYVLVPELLQGPASTGGFALTPTAAGLVLMATTLAFLLGGAIGGTVIPRLGVPGALAAAMALACCGYGALAFGRASVATTALLTAATFLGISVSIAAVTYGIAQAAPATTVATALALSETAFAIGTAIGAQLLATVVTDVGTVGGLPTDAAFTAGFALAACLALIASVAALAARPVYRGTR